MFCDLIYPSRAKSPELCEALDSEAISYYQRLLLTKTVACTHSTAVGSLPLPNVRGNEFSHWVCEVAEDVLLLVFQLKLIDVGYLYSNEFFDSIVRKRSAAVAMEVLTIVCEFATARVDSPIRRFDSPIQQLADGLATKIEESRHILQQGRVAYSDILQLAVKHIEDALVEAFQGIQIESSHLIPTMTASMMTSEVGRRLVNALKTRRKLLIAFVGLCHYSRLGRLLWVKRLIQDGERSTDLVKYAQDLPESMAKLRERSDGPRSNDFLESSAIFFLELLSAEAPVPRKLHESAHAIQALQAAEGWRRRLPGFSRPAR